MNTDIPTFGQRVEGENYQWRPGAYGIVLDEHQRVAVLQIPRGYFLPGGGREGNESPEETLAREILEECGCRVRIIGEVGVAMQFVGAPGEGYFVKRCIFYRAIFEDSGHQPGEADHHLLWLTPADASRRLNHASQSWAVERALSGDSPARIKTSENVGPFVIHRLPHPPTAVIFDMDGLLFDTESLYQKAIMAAAEEGGHDVTSTVRLMIGLPRHKSRLLLLDHYGAAFPVDEFLAAMVRHFDLLAATSLSLKPGAKELLDVLDDLRLPRAIATSSAHSTVQHHLATQNLVERFHQIVAHGDYVASKPAPDPFLKAAERLGVEPRLCLALEDSHNGVRSAASAGMMTVMVPDLLEPTDEIRRLCAFVARDLHEVRRVILNDGD